MTPWRGRLCRLAGFVCLAVLPAFFGDVAGAVLGAGSPTLRHHHDADSAAVGWCLAGEGNSPVGAHRLGNNSALPGVVTYVCPDGEVQITVPDARWPLGL
ncbi:MAG: hypothetical protein ACLQLO_08600 [Mycobacterium sp.]